MFGFGKPKSPLYDRLVATDIAQLEKRFAAMGDPSLPVVIAGLSMACGGAFLRACAPQMSRVTASIKPDVLAFEALAFAIYAVRESYMPMAEQIELDIQDEEDGHVDEERAALALRFAFAAEALWKRVKEDTGWDADEIWENRWLTYHATPSIGGAQGAVERFRFILMTIGKAREPRMKYGNVSLDLQATLEAMTATQAFVSKIPATYARMIEAYVDEHGIT